MLHLFSEILYKHPVALLIGQQVWRYRKCVQTGCAALSSAWDILDCNLMILHLIAF